MANTSTGNPIAPLPTHRPSLARSLSSQPLSSARQISPFATSPSPVTSTFVDGVKGGKEAMIPIARARRGTPAPLARTMSSQSLTSTSFGSNASPTNTTSSPSVDHRVPTPKPQAPALENFMGMLSNAHGLPSPKRRLTHARDDSFGASELEREQLRVMQEQIARQNQQRRGGDASSSSSSAAMEDRKPSIARDASSDSIFASPASTATRAGSLRGASNDMMATPPPPRPVVLKRQCTAPIPSQSSASTVHSIRTADWTGGSSSSSSNLSTPGLTPSHHHNGVVFKTEDPMIDVGAPGELVLDEDRELGGRIDDSPASSEIVTPERPFRLGSSIVAAAIGGPMISKKHQQDAERPILIANQHQHQHNGVPPNGQFTPQYAFMPPPPVPQPQQTQHQAEMEMIRAATGQMTPGQVHMTIPQAGPGGMPTAGPFAFPPQHVPAGVHLTSPPSAGSVGTSIGGSPMKSRPFDKDGDVWPPELQAAFDAALRIVPRLGRRKILIQTVDGAKPLGRNELIANYIYRQTGVLRSRKQVSSHIQVLKNVHKHNADWMSLVGEPGPEENDNFSPEQAHAFGAYLVNGTLHPIGNDPFPMPDMSPTAASPAKRAAQAARMNVGAQHQHQHPEDEGIPPVFFPPGAPNHHAALMGLSGIHPASPADQISPFGHPMHPHFVHPMPNGLSPAPFSAGPSPLTPEFLSAMSSAANSPVNQTAPPSNQGFLGPALGLLRGGVSMQRQGSSASLNNRMGALEVRSHAGSQSPEVELASSPLEPVLPAGPVSSLAMAPTSFMMWAAPEQPPTEEGSEEDDHETFVFATLNENESSNGDPGAILVEELDREGHDANIRFPGIVEAMTSARCPIVHAQVRAKLPSTDDNCTAAPGDVKAEIGVVSSSSFGGKSLGVAMTLVVGGKVVLRYATDLPAPAPVGDKFLYTAQLPGVFIGGLLKGTAEAESTSPLVAHSRDEVMFVRAALQQATILAEYHVLDSEANHDSAAEEDGHGGSVGETVLIMAYEFDVVEEGDAGTVQLRHVATRLRRGTPPRKTSTVSNGSKRASPPIPQIREPSPAVQAPQPFAGLAGPPNVVRPSSTSPSKKRHASKNLSISIPERAFSSMLGVPSSQPQSNGSSPSSRVATPGPLTPAVQIVHTPTVAPGAPGPGDVSSIRRLEQTWAAAAGMHGDLHSPAIATYQNPEHQMYPPAQTDAYHGASAREMQETADFQAVLSEFGASADLGLAGHMHPPPPPVPQVNVSAPFMFPGTFAPAPLPHQQHPEHSAALSHMYALTAAAHTPTYTSFPMHLPNGPATPFMPVGPPHHHFHDPTGLHPQAAQAPPRFFGHQSAPPPFAHPIPVSMDYFGHV